MAAQIATIGAFCSFAYSVSWSSSGLSVKPLSATLATYIAGLAVIRHSGLISAISSASRPIARTGLASSSSGMMRSSRATSLAASLSPERAFLFSRWMAFSTVPMSASASSVWMTSMSSSGLTLAGHVDHVVVLEAAHHVDDGVGFADVREELVAQSLALGRARHQTGDVDEFHGRMQHAFRLDDGGQRIEPFGSGTSTTPTLGSIVQNG